MSEHVGRLQTGPRERSPASYNTSKNSKFGSFGFRAFDMKDGC